MALVLLLSLTLAACGGGGDAPAPAPAPITDSGNGGDAGPPTGDPIKIGYVLPLSGPMASFSANGVGVRYIADEALRIINEERGGVFVDGEMRPIEIIWGDNETNPAMSTDVATKLVTQDGVDLLFGQWTPLTTSPVSAVAERNNIPAIVSNGPDTSWLEGGPFHWAFGMLFDYEKFLDEYFNGWDKMETNKKVGLVLDTNVDGVIMADIIKRKAAERGYEIFDPGRFPEGTTDYTQVLTQIQAAECDILVASLIQPECVMVWDQARQINYIPKTAVLSKGMHMSFEVVGLGEIGSGTGICIETQWSPQFPWTNSLNGKGAQQLSDEYEAAVNTSPDLELGWTWSLFEVAYDALTRAGTTDPEVLRQAIADTDLDTIYGRVTFDANQVGHVPIVFGQWVPDDGTWGYKKVIVAADWTPEVTDITPPVYVPNWNSSN